MAGQGGGSDVRANAEHHLTPLRVVGASQVSTKLNRQLLADTQTQTVAVWILAPRPCILRLLERLEQ